MDRRRHLAGGAGHAPVGDQRHLVTAVLQHAEERREFVQLRHAVGLRPLEAHHGDEIALQLAGLEGCCQLALVDEHPRRRLDHTMLRGHGGDLGHAASQVAFQHAQAALGRERPLGRTQDGFVEALRRSVTPDQLITVEERLLDIAAQALADHGVHILMQQAGVEQRAHHEGHAAAGMEMVHVGLAVGVDLRQRRHHLGKIGHVLPGQLDAGGTSERRNMQGVVGRTAGGVERDHRIDDGFLVHHPAQREIVARLRRQAGDLPRSFPGQGIA